MTGTTPGNRADAGVADGVLRDIPVRGVRRGYIPRPPSREELDRLSEAQALITDEWAGDPPMKAGRRDGA